MCTHQTKKHNNTEKLLKNILTIFGKYRTTKSRMPLQAKIILITFTLYGIIHISSGDIAPKLNEDDDPGDELLLKNKDAAGAAAAAAAGVAIINGAAVVTTKDFIESDDLNSITNTLNTATTKNSLPINDLGFIHAFIASISVILVSELGDKTFFIAAIMAMRHARLTIFIGAMSALGLMTVLSAVFGMAATIIPRVYTYYISTALFAIFGLKMLKEGYYMSPTDAQEELEEVQSDLRKREDELEREVSSTLVPDSESGGVIRKNRRSAAYMASRVFMQAFTMTFLAEWGDRSQLTTIILSAREDVYGVIVGGVLGHSICTGLAVIGGRMIAQKISVRTVTLIGGVVFLVFAISALFFNPNEE